MTLRGYQGAMGIPVRFDWQDHRYVWRIKPVHAYLCDVALPIGLP